jgi:anti-sigma factor (TIGR02949 family)
VSCNYLDDRLHGYLDNELDAAGAADFERHLQTCAQCSRALETERALREDLNTAQLYERAPARLRHALRQVRKMETSKSAETVTWKWLAIATLFLLAATSGLLAWNRLRTRDSAPAFAVAAVDAHLRSLQPGHLADVESSDQHTVKPWFDGRIDFAPKVADFSSEGFRLLGGRLDVLNGRTVAALVFNRRKHIINVFIAQQGSIPIQSGFGSAQGYRWLAWESGGLHYIAVTDAGAADLEDLRTLLAKE